MKNIFIYFDKSLAPPKTDHFTYVDKEIYSNRFSASSSTDKFHSEYFFRNVFFTNKKKLFWLLIQKLILGTRQWTKNPLPANSKINKLPKFSEQYNIYILVNWPCSSSFHPQRVDRVQYTSCNLLKFCVCAMHHCQWEMFDKKLISGIVDNTISAHSKL